MAKTRKQKRTTTKTTKSPGSKRRAMTQADVQVKLDKHSRLLEKAIKRTRRAVNRTELHRV